MKIMKAENPFTIEVNFRFKMYSQASQGVIVETKVGCLSTRAVLAKNPVDRTLHTNCV